ncbi:unnamed protein product [Linum tenue]|uniref:Uncharacterized protein n=1 Tax=Linum tenue TaxID=586396 RepID=A0AAV0J8Q9_9ROSI|nr:unnamed protein product [Linum tenue]
MGLQAEVTVEASNRVAQEQQQHYFTVQL